MSHFVVVLLLLFSDTDAPSPKPSDPVICKKFDETGSLIRKKKICRTKSDWVKATSALQDSANRFVEDRRGRPPTGN